MVKCFEEKDRRDEKMMM